MLTYLKHAESAWLLNRHLLVRQAVLFVAGLVIGLVGQTFSFQLALALAPDFAPVWIPGGVLFALFLIRPARDWPVLAFGVSLGCANRLMQFGVPFSYAIGMYLALVSEMAAAAWPFRRVKRSLFTDVRTFFAYVLLVGLVLSSLAGLTAAYVGYIVKMRPNILDSWVTLAPDEALAFLILSPLIVAIVHHRDRPRSLDWPASLEAVVLSVGMLGLSMSLWFFSRPVPGVSLIMLLLIPIPLLLIAAVRFGVLGSTIALFITGVAFTWLAVFRNAPFQLGSGRLTVHLIQLWLLALGPLVHTLAIQSQQERSMYDQLLTAHESIRVLASRLLVTQEQERARIARELHDDISQQIALFGIKLSLLKNGGEKLPERIEELQSLVRHLREDVRRMSHNLHPAALQHSGLTTAIRALVLENAAHWHGEITFSVDRDDINPDHEQALCLYRICQEAIANAINHGNAQRIHLSLTERNGEYLLSIKDDGQGFNAKNLAPASGLGLLSMRERAALVRGGIDVSSDYGIGTTVSARVPA